MLVGRLSFPLGVITRSDVAQCYTALPGRLIDYEAGFIATMLWGYGNSNEAGPVKAWCGFQTPAFGTHMPNALSQLARGLRHFGDALNEAMKIDEVGVAFGTKILYFMGLSMSITPVSVMNSSDDNLKKSAIRSSMSLANPIPLIMDSAVCGSLIAIFGDSLAKTHFGIIRGTPTGGDGYVAYCEALHYWAAVVGGGCTADMIEMYLFQEKRRLTQAAKVKGLPLG